MLAKTLTQIDPVLLPQRHAIVARCSGGAERSLTLLAPPPSADLSHGPIGAIAGLRRFAGRVVVTAAAGLVKSGLTSHFEGPGLVSILFHGLGTDREEEFSDQVDPLNPITVAEFAATVNHFKAKNYRFVGPDDIRNGLDPGERYVWLTIDDGYATNLRALPVLEAADAKATFFISTSNVLTGQGFWWDALWRGLRRQGLRPAEIVRQRELLKLKHWKAIEEDIANQWGYRAFDPVSERDRPLSVSELKTLAAHRCVNLGNHTRNHAILTCLSREEVIEQVAGCQEDLASMTGGEPISIAYPNGSTNNEVAGAVAELGFSSGLGCRMGRNAIPIGREARFNLRRDVIRHGLDVVSQCNAIGIGLRRYL